MVSCSLLQGLLDQGLQSSRRSPLVPLDRSTSRLLRGAMYKAWGLQREALFKDLGNNIFVIYFDSDGDWKHALFNGPWQFNLSVVMMKDYEGDTRPSEIVINGGIVHDGGVSRAVGGGRAGVSCPRALSPLEVPLRLVGYDASVVDSPTRHTSSPFTTS